ncbi:MAG: hypothetical protein WB998_06515 [Solirubrobacteraceae bacterium]
MIANGFKSGRRGGYGSGGRVMAVKLEDGDLFVIHAMPMRKKYMTKYKEATK